MRVPQGWREVDNNDDGFIDLWLVNTSDDASIVLTPVNSELQINSRIKSDLDVIKDFYLSYVKASNKNIIVGRRKRLSMPKISLKLSNMNTQASIKEM